MTTSISEDRPATDGVRTLLRLEGLALATAACLAYWHVSGDWKWFAILFLAPDLSMAFYLFGSRVGAFAYNAAHSTLGAAALALLGVAMQRADLVSLALIWLAHIGFDRALGYGLKRASGFGDTHLGRIGAKKN